MSEVTVETPPGVPDDQQPKHPRFPVVVHRLDGGLEEGEGGDELLAVVARITRRIVSEENPQRDHEPARELERAT